ncbi:MAG: polyphenol oxidase family protein, partial [Actinomycetota bacterium]|nr:polyphenol oxidase family protein [Actinomycetota bacterium]
MAIENVSSNGLHIVRDLELEARYGIVVAFTNGFGGVSSGPFESLNLSFNVGDRQENVLSNRKRVGGEIGIPPSSWITAKQVHGTNIVLVGEREKGRGGLDYSSAIPDCDGLICSTKGIACVMLIADCLPVAIISPKNHVVAISHCGWRGILGGMPELLLENLCKAGNVEPYDCFAIIGPHICNSCFE